MHLDMGHNGSAWIWTQSQCDIVCYVIISHCNCAFCLQATVDVRCLLLVLLVQINLRRLERIRRTEKHVSQTDASFPPMFARCIEVNANYKGKR